MAVHDRPPPAHRPPPTTRPPAHAGAPEPRLRRAVAVRDGGDPAGAVLDRLGAQGAVDELVAELTPEQAEAVLLRVVGGLPVAEVARIMDRPAGTRPRPVPPGAAPPGGPLRRRGAGRMTVDRDVLWADLVQFDPRPPTGCGTATCATPTPRAGTRTWGPSSTGRAARRARRAGRRARSRRHHAPGQPGRDDRCPAPPPGAAPVGRWWR